MSAESKEVLTRIVRSEIEAFQRDIASSPPARSAIFPHAIMAPNGDAREVWLGKIRTAFSELQQVRV